MTDDEIAAIAAEPQESQLHRTRLASQIAVLEDAIRICRRHARQGAMNGMSLKSLSEIIELTHPRRSNYRTTSRLLERKSARYNGRQFDSRGET